MAEPKNQIIIIKKKKGGHGGGHGGAWKVAYADFVTAMMCFFLVMWLMGADEEVKQSISNYFNNPTSAWRPDLSSERNIPLGNKTGAGENVLNGADGQVPEAQIQMPSSEFYLHPEETRETAEPDRELLAHRIPDVDANVELVKFTIPESILFRLGTDELKSDASQYLDKVGKLLRKTNGNLTINGFTNPKPELPSGSNFVDDYEFSVARVVAIHRYLTSKRFIDENKAAPHVIDSTRTLAGESPSQTPRERSIEFIVRTVQ